MVKGKQISQEVREIVLRLANEGKHYRDICELTNVPVSSISLIVRTQYQHKRLKRGPHSKLNRIQRRNLVRYVRTHRFDSVEKMKDALHLTILRAQSAGN